MMTLNNSLLVWRFRLVSPDIQDY